ncbi:RNase adapter RapZ [Maritimibacter sp. 55A14]|uniref:RNase adapter RapZ n=1 Tax=Maritimibacter sp. 55A14 TaxID=2174844 RepID=UPI000D60D3D9|nr:RNase adapter RapZ [Maritimibacter sp. 55A14]PWE32505.1 RNase adapter RapZ [Maritimibacter sp. 55A14]
MGEGPDTYPGGPAEAQEIVLVTGPSGGGRTSAIRALEDLGYESIDNLPLSFLPRLLSGPPLGRPLALGVDVRNRDFSSAGVVAAMGALERDPAVSAQLLYLDCTADVIVQRYSETRRRHPLAPSESPRDGIEREFDILAPVRARADLLIDTSELTPQALRAEIARWFGGGDAQRLAISAQSFSYKRGVPRGADMVFDCRFLKNPHWEPDLRPMTGLDAAVVAHVATDPRLEPFCAQTLELLVFLLPAFREEGKSHLTVAFGCTGGQHRSVAVTEKLAKGLAQKGWQVSIRHRELERRAGGAQQRGLGDGA